MTDARHNLLHGLGVLKAAKAPDLARRVGLPVTTVDAELAAAEMGGRVVQAGGRWTLAPLAWLALQADYSRVYADIRDYPEISDANTAFEQINRRLKELMTDWQVISLAGERVPNDHQDQTHDARIIDRLGKLHEQVTPILQRFEAAIPRLAFYRTALLAALERAEDGDIAWVSDVALESYHTLWFELHEELIRILGGRRSD